MSVWSRTDGRPQLSYAERLRRAQGTDDVRATQNAKSPVVSASLPSSPSSSEQVGHNKAPAALQTFQSNAHAKPACSEPENPVDTTTTAVVNSTRSIDSGPSPSLLPNGTATTPEPRIRTSPTRSSLPVSRPTAPGARPSSTKAVPQAENIWEARKKQMLARARATSPSARNDLRGDAEHVSAAVSGSLSKQDTAGAHAPSMHSEKVGSACQKTDGAVPARGKHNGTSPDLLRSPGLNPPGVGRTGSPALDSSQLTPSCNLSTQQSSRDAWGKAKRSGAIASTAGHEPDRLRSSSPAAVLQVGSPVRETDAAPLAGALLVLGRADAAESPKQHSLSDCADVGSVGEAIDAFKGQQTNPERLEAVGSPDRRRGRLDAPTGNDPKDRSSASKELAKDRDAPIDPSSALSNVDQLREAVSSDELCKQVALQESKSATITDSNSASVDNVHKWPNGAQTSLPWKRDSVTASTADDRNGLVIAATAEYDSAYPDSLPDSLRPYDRARDPLNHRCGPKSSHAIEGESGKPEASGGSRPYPDIHPQYVSKIHSLREVSANGQVADLCARRHHSLSRSGGRGSQGEFRSGRGSGDSTSTLSGTLPVHGNDSVRMSDDPPDIHHAAYRHNGMQPADSAFDRSSLAIGYGRAEHGVLSPHAFPYGTPIYFDGINFYPASPLSTTAFALVTNAHTGPSLGHPVQPGLPAAGTRPHYSDGAGTAEAGSDLPLSGAGHRNSPLSPQALSSSQPVLLPMLSPLPDLHALITQLEFYFSPQNLAHDPFLRHQMDPTFGWVPLALVATFKRLKSICQHLGVSLDNAEVKDLIAQSNSIELDREGRRIRKRFDWGQWPVRDATGPTTPPHSAIAGIASCDDGTSGRWHSQLPSDAGCHRSPSAMVITDSMAPDPAYRAWLSRAQVGRQAASSDSASPMTPYTGHVFSPALVHNQTPDGPGWQPHALDYGTTAPTSLSSDTPVRPPFPHSHVLPSHHLQIDLQPAYYHLTHPSLHHAQPMAPYTEQQPTKYHDGVQNDAALYPPNDPQRLYSMKHTTTINGTQKAANTDLVQPALRASRDTELDIKTPNQIETDFDASGEDHVKAKAVRQTNVKSGREEQNEEVNEEADDEDGDEDGDKDGDDDDDDCDDDDDDECLGVIAAEGLGGLVEPKMILNSARSAPRC
ncbi:unnamed protein product [Parajaminaea phylloscopi]